MKAVRNASTINATSEGGRSEGDKLARISLMMFTVTKTQRGERKNESE